MVDDEFTPRELGLLSGNEWAKHATPQQVAEIAETRLVPDVVRDTVMRDAGMKNRIDEYDNPADAEDAFWQGFIHGVRACMVEDLDAFGH